MSHRRSLFGRRRENVGRRPLTVSTAQNLSGSYQDEAVERLASEDGAAQLFTSAWGSSESNRDLHAVDAINDGAAVSAGLVSHTLHGELPELERKLESLVCEVPLAEHEVFVGIDECEVAEDDVDHVQQKCGDGGLPVPDTRWQRTIGEIVALAVLGIGDLYFSATAFQIFGLSDKPLGWLPFNELQLASSSVVAAMLMLTRLAGHFARSAAHTLSRRSEGDVKGRAPVPRRWAWIVAAFGILAVSGAVVVLLGLSEVRAAFLALSGVAAQTGPFLLIQAGVATAGFVLSFSVAHPFEDEWRSARGRLTRAQRALHRSCGVLSDVVAGFNATLRERNGLLCQFRDWTMATVDDAARKGHVYARRAMLAQPEPVVTEMFPNGLPAPGEPPLVAAVNDLVAGSTSPLRNYAPLAMARVQQRLDEADARRRTRHAPPTEPES